ncbi:oligosaccharide flippase family protein, partial [Clostridium perfringens]
MCTKILFRKGGIKIDKKLKSGLIYNFIAKYSNVLISLVLTSILARLLSPDDFGIVGVVMVFVTFFNMLGDMGFGPAIIQNKKLNKDEVEEIFTFTIIIAIVAAIIFAIFSYFIAYFYSNKVYIGIGKSLAIAIFFYIVNIVPTAVLYKEKRFKLVAIGSVIINIIVGIIAILVALYGARYYTLVIQSILASMFTFLC